MHPGADWDSVRSHLIGPIRAVRERRGLARMATGLWLSADCVAQLDANPTPLADALAEARVDLVTLNGFPYGDFHAARVKQEVYRPAWDQPQRHEYTLALARVLTRCLPSDAAYGSISTLPLGYLRDWNAERNAMALAQLCRLAAALSRLADDSGRRVRVCLEPEPDCVLQTTDDALRLFTEQLPATARRLGVPGSVLQEHLGLCFDICHQAVQFEDPARSLADLSAAGIGFGKIQVSSALNVGDPVGAFSSLSAFAEPRYLHQVRCRRPDGSVVGSPDLEQALSDPAFPRDGAWRVHFHVPIQRTEPGRSGLGTTSGAIDAVLNHLAEAYAGTPPQPRPHLEVETYTWQVMPEQQRPHDQPTLVAGIAAELDWLRARLAGHGLLRTGPAEPRR